MSNSLSEPHRELATQEIKDPMATDQLEAIMVARCKFIIGLLFDNGLMDGSTAMNSTATMMALAQVVGVISIHSPLLSEDIVRALLQARENGVARLVDVVQLTTNTRAQS